MHGVVKYKLDFEGDLKSPSRKEVIREVTIKGRLLEGWFKSTLDANMCIIQK